MSVLRIMDYIPSLLCSLIRISIDLSVRHMYDIPQKTRFKQLKNKKCSKIEKPKLYGYEIENKFRIMQLDNAQRVEDNLDSGRYKE